MSRAPGPLDVAPVQATQAGLADGVKVRREPFGGLVYTFQTRRLHVVRSSTAIEVALRLDAGASLEDVSSWLVDEELATDIDAARAFVIRTVDRFCDLEVMTWITS